MTKEQVEEEIGMKLTDEQYNAYITRLEIAKKDIANRIKQPVKPIITEHVDYYNGVAVKSTRFGGFRI